MINDDFAVMGTIDITEYCKKTGEVVGHFSDENVITEQGINTLFLRLALEDNQDRMMFTNFSLGNDDGSQEDSTGGWTQLDPMPAKKRYTSMNQLTVYDVPPVDMVFDYPSQNEFQAATLLDGDYILDNFYPDEVDMIYTSATLRFKNGTSFSYKRFPARSLSRLIDVQIIWTFKFVNEHDYLCPVPPSEAEPRLYMVKNNMTYLHEIENEDIEKKTVDSSSDVSLVKAQPNGDVVSIEGDKLVKRQEDGTVDLDIALNIPDSVKVFDVDANSVPYLGLSTSDGKVVKTDKNGSVIWTTPMEAEIASVWIVNNSRLCVVTEDSDVDPATSENKMYILSATDGTIIYERTSVNSNNTTGKLDFASSSGGEFFAIQKPVSGSDKSYLVKLAYDLTEISRIELSGEVRCIYADHNNDILVGHDTFLSRYDADLNYIWQYDGGEYNHISVDRDARVYCATDDKVDVLDSELELFGSYSISGVTDISAVGRKWSYFS